MAFRMGGRNHKGHDASPLDERSLPPTDEPDFRPTVGSCDTGNQVIVVNACSTSEGRRLGEDPRGDTGLPNQTWWSGIFKASCFTRPRGV